MICAEEITRRMIVESCNRPAFAIRRFIGSDLSCCYLLTHAFELAWQQSIYWCMRSRYKNDDDLEDLTIVKTSATA